MKTLQQMQDENRRAVIMACNPTAKSYEEALEMELGFGCEVIDLKHTFLGGESPEKMILVYDGDFHDYFLHFRGNPTVKIDKERTKNQEYCKIIGKPLTLDRVLIALKNIKIYMAPCIFCCERSALIWEILDGSEIINFYTIDWDLTKSTLKEQSEETQRAINKLILE